MNYDCLGNRSGIQTEEGYCVRNIYKIPQWFNTETGNRGRIISNPVDGMDHFVEVVKS